MKLGKTELIRLIAGGETNTVEFKIASPRPIEMAQRLCGMANAQGGVIIIGVRDADLEIVGVPDDRLASTMDVIHRASRQICQPSLVLTPPEPEIYIVDDKKLVVVGIPPSGGPLYQAGGVFWKRRGTTTGPMNVLEVMESTNDRGSQKWELQPAWKSTMKDIDFKKVEVYLSQRSTRGHAEGRFENLEEVLIGMHCALMSGNGEIVPTNAGLLFFGYDPQQNIYQSEVVCVLFQDELGIGGYLDRKIVRGTVQELIDETEIFLKKHVMVAGKVVGWKRIDTPEYPIEALREAVVNAVIHRDYSRDGESARVFFYSDRIEIHSPGLLLPGITVEQMVRGAVMSKLRNPILANLLRDVPGYMERIGSEIKLMHREMSRLGLPAPQFREIGEFVVTFSKLPVQGTMPSDLPSSEGEQLTIYWEEAVEEMGTDVDEELAIQERRILVAMRYIRENGFIVNSKYRELTGVSEMTALRDLDTLVARGTLKKVGTKRGRRYQLP